VEHKPRAEQSAALGYKEKMRRALKGHWKIRVNHSTSALSGRDALPWNTQGGASLTLG